MDVDQLQVELDVKMNLNDDNEKENIHFNEEQKVLEEDDEWEDIDDDDNQEDFDPILEKKLNTAQKRAWEHNSNLQKQETHVHFGPKIFDPLEWSLDNFEIGMPLSWGKYGHLLLVREKTTK